MESIKEFLNPKSFNRLSFVVVIIWLLIGIILLGIFANNETNEQSSFHCRVLKDKEKGYIQGLCFDDYQTKFTRGFPLYGFVLLNFLLIVVVCLIYSQFVKPRIKELESEDVEIQRNHSHSRRLYISYCCQLATRFSLGIVFLILQTLVVYPFNFPSKYDCDSSQFKQAKNINITNNARNIKGTSHDCHNPLASKKTSWAIILCVVNAVFAVLILLELIYVITKAKKDDNFMKDSAFFKIYLLSKDNKIVKKYVEEMKEWISNNTKHCEPLLPNIPGEETNTIDMDKIYTNLIIYPGRATYEFSESRYEILKGYVKSQEKQSINNLEDIFAPSRDNPNKVPLNIMIVGRPGIGKSLLCQKILRVWACDKMFNGETGKYFEFVYLYKFRKFNSDEKLNLQQLLDRFSGTLRNEVFGYILNNPEKVLVVFDGLDEFVDKSNFVKEEEFGNNLAETIPFSALYAKLSSGKLLKGATIVTTSRPTALSFVQEFNFDRTIEVLGFNSKQIEEFVTKFFSQDDSARQTVWNHISTNANLLSLCYIPVNCHIVCFSFQEKQKSYEEDDYLPITITKIYKDALKLIVFKHNPEYRNNDSERSEDLFSSVDFTPKAKAILKSLGEIAYRGIEERRLIFESEEVKGQEESSLLHRLPDHKQTGQIERKPQFCFLHLTMQEFLAAWHIVETKKDDLQSWVSNHIREGKWQTVIPFVAGLLHDEDESNIKIFTDLLPASTFKEKDVICWPVKEDKGLVLMLFKCIFEISRSFKIDEKVVGMEAVDLSYLQITDADLPAVAYVLQEVKSIHTFNVIYNYIGPLGCLEICKMLKMGNLTTLYIAGNKIGDEGLKHLSDALSKNECKLTTLDIGWNNISDIGAKHFSDALFTNECKLTTLNIQGNEISDYGVKHLSDALSKNECKLTTLDIGWNNISDIGAKHFSDALSTNECKLTTLNIQGNEICDYGFKYLSDAFSKNECKLKTLDISGNNMGDDGVKHLDYVLSKPE